MKRLTYRTPSIESERSCETSALACGKTSDPPPGSFHWGPPGHNVFTGHFGPGFGGSESESGTIYGTGTPPNSSHSYSYAGLCSNWVSWHS